VAFLLLFIACRWLGAADTLFDVATQHDIMVPMRDGVKLATDIYSPARDGKAPGEPLPVILTRLPYNKTGAKSFGEYFAAHGYVFVAQDTRGPLCVGRRLAFPHGRRAGWLGFAPIGSPRQPWSNGKLGMIGTSYVGGTQGTRWGALEKVPQLP